MLDMSHLPGFWNEANWDDACWAEYQRRRREHGRKNRFEQFLHRLMGKFMSYEAWCRREAAQWPSTSGSYDPAEDHYNFLWGAHRRQSAAELLARIRALHRPEFLR